MGWWIWCGSAQSCLFKGFLWICRVSASLLWQLQNNEAELAGQFHSTYIQSPSVVKLTHLAASVVIFFPLFYFVTLSFFPCLIMHWNICVKELDIKHMKQLLDFNWQDLIFYGGFCSRKSSFFFFFFPLSYVTPVFQLDGLFVLVCSLPRFILSGLRLLSNVIAWGAPRINTHVSFFIAFQDHFKRHNACECLPVVSSVA